MSEAKPLVFGVRPSGGLPDFLRSLIVTLKENGTLLLAHRCGASGLTREGVSVPLIFNNVTRRIDVEKVRTTVERGMPVNYRMVCDRHAS